MSQKLLVLDVVGLTPALIGPHTPNLARLAGEGFQAELRGVFPAVTCTAQSTLLTGKLPRHHGIVGNGWYFRDLAEVWLWRQSNRLVGAPKIWETLRQRRPGFTCAKIFWWYNMHSSADWAVTPRPVYPADGRKIPSIYTQPPDLKEALEEALGPFPLFEFWGPRAGIRSSEWIARCALRVIERHLPDLALVYLPHLDYDFQRYGPDHPVSIRALRDIDRVAGEVIDAARGRGYAALVVSEYGIAPVRGSISINRMLRREGFLRAQSTLAGELLDAGASRAFAVSDHQAAHVYIEKPQDIEPVKKLLEALPGVERVLDAEGKAAFGLDHPRSGELVAVARPECWFDYYYWLDDRDAPDFARTVDIHRKPGYDPVELFIDPELRLAKLKILYKLLRKKLGFRYLLDVISLDPGLVKGSHGRLPDDPRQGPVLISSSRALRCSSLEMTEVAGMIERMVLEG